MASAFMGLEIGKRSIVTQQVALDVVGHNISNANTAGYTRQAANLVTTIPWHTPMLTGNYPIGQFGTGVMASDIQRFRNSFIDSQIRKETQTAGYWTVMQENYSQIESILNEPNNEGLRGVMDLYWQSWQDLSGNSENESTRSVVIERAQGMTEAFNHSYQQLVALRDDVNSTIQVKVDEVNSIAMQIRDLNQQILSVTIAGKQPNDLLDKRDLLIDDLSQLIDIQVYDDLNKYAQNDTTGKVSKYSGLVTIQVGGRAMVQGQEICKLACKKDANGMNMVVWEDTQVKAKVEGGEMRSLLDMRGKTLSKQEQEPSEYKEIIPKMIDNLNRLAQTMIERTNALHRSGYSLNNKTGFPDGQDFFKIPDDMNNFDGNWAKYMAVDETIVNDIRSLAAASYRTWDSNGARCNYGDGANALKIAQLKQDLDRREYTVQTEDLKVPYARITFPSNVLAGTIRIGFADGSAMPTEFTNITLDTPVKPYTDLQSVADAIQAKLNTSTILADHKVTIKVRCNGNKLEFYSTSENFRSVADGDGSIPADPSTYLLGGASFTSLPAETTENPLVQDATDDDYWRKICGDIGVESQEATRMVKNQATLLNELENKRQALSGVSTDEELTSMIKFQHAYNAASRFITTIDEQLETIITGMGLVGR